MDNPKIDPLFHEHQSINMATAASIQGRIAFGPNAGKKVTRLDGSFGYIEEAPLAAPDCQITLVGRLTV